ncbi:hypothetical protein V2W45_1229309, partial [Cenococcum geophilum]
VWVYDPCGFAVKPNHYKAHLMTRHSNYPNLSYKEKVQLVIAELTQKPLSDPQTTRILTPTVALYAIPFLPIYNGLACL